MTGAKPTANPLFLRDDDLRQGMELLYFAYRDFARDADDILAARGLGRTHHRVLHFVCGDPGISVSELRSILKITKQSLSRVVSELVRDGFVAESQGTSDRRRKLLEPTSEGSALEKLLSETQRERIARAYSEAGAEAVQGFRRVLAGMVGENDRARVAARRRSAGPPQCAKPFRS